MTYAEPSLNGGQNHLTEHPPIFFDRASITHGGDGSFYVHKERET